MIMSTEMEPFSVECLKGWEGWLPRRLASAGKRG